MAIGVTAANRMLDRELQDAETTIYVSLHDGDPGLTGSNEITGGGYARQAATFAPAANRAAVTDGDVDFEDMPTATITHAALWIHPTSTDEPDFVIGGELTTPKSIANAGDTFRLPLGDVTFALNGS